MNTKKIAFKARNRLVFLVLWKIDIADIIEKEVKKKWIYL